jgi:hypothetical protein
MQREAGPGKVSNNGSREPLTPHQADAALGYAALDWHVLQVQRRSKKPVADEWQKVATVDPATIVRWWPPGSRLNLGVQLGPRSNIIDVECDTPAAERALAELLGDDYPVVPTFKARRGNHRLFRWTPDLPRPDKSVFKFRGIEFRTGNGGKGAQSLFPPSVHPDGPVYTWLVHPDEADPVPFPAAALAVIRRELGGADRGTTCLADGEVFTQGRRNDTLFRVACRLRHYGHSEAEIRALLLVMNADRCDPELADDEVEKIARSAAQYDAPPLAGGAVLPARPPVTVPPRRSPLMAEWLARRIGGR